MFAQLAYEEINEQNRNKMLNEVFHLLTKDEVIARLIDLMQSIINNHESNRPAKNMCTLNQRDKNGIVDLVKLEFKGFVLN